MNPFNFLGGAFNQLLMNPRSPEQEKKDLYDLKNAFEQKYGSKNYFLVPSSGSSANKHQSVKLIALHSDAVLNSAQRVNSFFNLNARNEKFNFGCVLPTFHVGGLGIYARAFLAKSRVYENIWNPETIISWIEDDKINILSLVPTQIFDIVKNNLQAPKILKVVFVGGAKLSPELKAKAQALKWILVETYGMTETSSMIAASTAYGLQPLPDVEVAENDGKLKIRCDSLMTCSLQKVGNEIEIVTLDQGWLQTSDRVEFKTVSGYQIINILGRESDFIKINGEGVSLSALRSLFGDDRASVIVALAHDRSGYEIVAVCDKNLDHQSVISQIDSYNQQVKPFEKIKKLFKVDNLPRTELKKIKYQNLEEIIKGLNYETL